MTSRTAYGVLTFDKNTGQLLSMGIFSERSPTVTRGPKVRVAFISVNHPDGYGAAVSSLRGKLAAPQYQWMHRFWDADRKAP